MPGGGKYLEHMLNKAACARGWEGPCPSAWDSERQSTLDLLFAASILAVFLLVSPAGEAEMHRAPVSSQGAEVKHVHQPLRFYSCFRDLSLFLFPFKVSVRSCVACRDLVSKQTSL